jgi:Uma2 family endonuclease
VNGMMIRIDVGGAAVKTLLNDYYKSENLRDWKHEYFQGQTIARRHGAIPHSQINVSLGSELSQRLRKSSYQAFGSTLRVRIDAADCVLYPDVSVLLGQPELDPDDPVGGTIKNPCVVIEVNALSTDRFDPATRREQYLKLTSLRAHLLVDQDRPRVEVLSRTEDDRWELSFATGLDASLTIDAIGVEIPLREVYDRVEFPPPQPPIGGK